MPPMPTRYTLEQFNNIFSTNNCKLLDNIMNPNYVIYKYIYNWR